MVDANEAPATVVDYYDALELALSAFTSTRSEYRRHFGYATEPAPPGYCWFKGVVSPERHPDYTDWLIPTGTELEARLLAHLPRLQPSTILDIGCGNGALLKRLSERGVTAQLTGINLQATQVQAARRLLAGTHAEVIEADFLRHELGRRFDLVYLFESAFHVSEKAELCQRIARSLTAHGEAWLLDIVVAERAVGAFGSLGGKQSLFSYAPRADWQRWFGQAGMREVEFTDLSDGIARFLQVSDPLLLRDEYFAPRLTAALEGVLPLALRQARFEQALHLLLGIAREYRRLSRLLGGGMLQYVLMRYARSG